MVAWHMRTAWLTVWQYPKETRTGWKERMRKGDFPELRLRKRVHKRYKKKVKKVSSSKHSHHSHTSALTFQIWRIRYNNKIQAKRPSWPLSLSLWYMVRWHTKAKPTPVRRKGKPFNLTVGNSKGERRVYFCHTAKKVMDFLRSLSSLSL